MDYFEKLNSIDCSKHVEKKGGFSYLSWPYAVAQLRLAEPTATWEVKRFDGLPFMVTPAGVFVEVAVTVQGLTLSQIHPVLDARNKVIADPDAFAINTSIQRCLVKAIALHGLGLYIYAGEDLPDAAEAKAGKSKDTAPISATREAWEALDEDTQRSLRTLAQEVTAAMPDAQRALDVLAFAQLDNNDHKAGLWHLLDSATRSGLKKAQAAL